MPWLYCDIARMFWLGFSTKKKKMCNLFFVLFEFVLVVQYVTCERHRAIRQCKYINQ